MKIKKKSSSQKEELDELIRRGVHITNNAQEGDILYTENPVDQMHEVFKAYHLWKIDVGDFFLKDGFDHERSFFMEGDDVPMLKGGIAYSRVDTPESKKLLMSVRNETKKKLEFLRGFASKEQVPPIPKKAIVSLPKGAAWEKLTLKMKEGQRDLEVFYAGGHITTTDFIKLGCFVGSKNKAPDRQWSFLCALSVLAGTDISQATVANMKRMIPAYFREEKDMAAMSVHQVRTRLAKHLRKVFGIESDPFYKDTGFYSPKFKLLPEATLRQENPWRQGGKLDENQSFQDTQDERPD